MDGERQGSHDEGHLLLPMIPKINLFSCLAALFLFVMPWLEIQCSGKPIATQSGLQLIYGGAKPAPELAGLNEQAKMNHQKAGTPASEEPWKSVGISFLAGGALALIGMATAKSLQSFRNGRGALEPGILCAAALACLALQSYAGFPVQRSLVRSMQEGKSSSGNAPEDKLGDSMAQAVALGIQVKTTAAWYLEMIALGIPTLVLANGLLDRMKKREGEPG